MDAREEATDIGRRLDVCGFVFSAPPDAIFRNIGPTYVRDAWQRLGQVLNRHGVAADDLSWGMMHPGETHIRRLRNDEPCRFIGWTSRNLVEFDADARWGLVDAELGVGTPPLRSAVTWRSLRWQIGGEEVALGLRLFEALATDEYTDWSPHDILAGGRNLSEPWVRVAAALRDVSQTGLDSALAAAERSYSTLGYRIVLRGYQAFATGWGLALRFPDPPELGNV
ncbi:MAG: hypothetical protein K2X38_03270 [Gemmataceae bacterium]|nr:hypothetical protein [Gemmataceae bacterium]